MSSDHITCLKVLDFIYHYVQSMAQKKRKRGYTNNINKYREKKKKKRKKKKEREREREEIIKHTGFMYK